MFFKFYVHVSVWSSDTQFHRWMKIRTMSDGANDGKPWATGLHIDDPTSRDLFPEADRTNLAPFEFSIFSKSFICITVRRWRGIRRMRSHCWRRGNQAWNQQNAFVYQLQQQVTAFSVPSHCDGGWCSGHCVTYSWISYIFTLLKDHPFVSLLGACRLFVFWLPNNEWLWCWLLLLFSWSILY